MTTDHFTVLPHEWDVLCGLIDAFGPEGPVNAPLLVAHPRGGVAPFWRLTGPDGIELTVVHELDEPRPGDPYHDAVVVPTALVRHGHLLAHTEGSCELVIDDDYAHLRGGRGSTAVYDRPDPDVWWSHPQVPFVPELGPLAEAVVEAGGLCRAMVTAGVWPGRIDEDVAPPVVEVAIEGDQLAFGANWRPHGGHRVTNRIPAHAQGAASIGFDHTTVERLLTLATVPDDMVEVRIHDSCVVFETPRWTAIVPQVETGQARLLADAADLLEQSGFVVTWLSSSAVTVNGDPFAVVDRVRIEGFVPGDGDPGVVRISSVMVDGAHDTPELRARMDGMASAGAGLSVWFEDGRVVVATDLESGRLAELPSLVDRFRNRIVGLDVLLADAGGATQLVLPSGGDGPGPESRSSGRG